MLSPSYLSPFNRVLQIPFIDTKLTPDVIKLEPQFVTPNSFSGLITYVWLALVYFADLVLTRLCCHNKRHNFVIQNLIRKRVKCDMKSRNFIFFQILTLFINTPCIIFLIECNTFVKWKVPHFMFSSELADVANELLNTT